MRATAVVVTVAFLAAIVFALSNTGSVTVMFWQWPIYQGSLALAIVGAGVLGALLTFVPSLARHARLHGRIRDLERQLSAHELPRPASSSPSPGIEQTQRLR